MEQEKTVSARRNKKCRKVEQQISCLLCVVGMTQSRSKCTRNNRNQTNQISRQSKHNHDFVVFVLPNGRLWILKHAGLEAVSEWQWISGAVLKHAGLETVSDWQWISGAVLL
jgi:hypothetical protein